jgi:Tfp pilus assembly protein PilF
MVLARDDPNKALALLDVALRETRQEGDTHLAASLARHAGVLSTMAGDLAGAQRYYQEALEDDPTDPYLFLALADTCERLKDPMQAIGFFERAQQLAEGRHDVELASAAARGAQRLSEALTVKTHPDGEDS